ncbi:unnamed protein product, partial [marine sediment metagenome]
QKLLGPASLFLTFSQGGVQGKKFKGSEVD